MIEDKDKDLGAKTDLGREVQEIIMRRGPIPTAQVIDENVKFPERLVAIVCKNDCIHLVADWHIDLEVEYWTYLAKRLNGQSWINFADYLVVEKGARFANQGEIKTIHDTEG